MITDAFEWKIYIVNIERSNLLLITQVYLAYLYNI